jgi:predicted ATP-grasp superfamily ATP-dependent carboligase
VRVLVTSSRNPFAVDIVRKLAIEGHEVWAADTFASAAGNHSRYVTGHAVYASPRQATGQFVADVLRTVEANDIELVVPTFEEAFYLATRHAELDAVTKLYTGKFPQLARLHDKVSFQRVCGDAGVRIPETAVAHDDAELKAAIARWPQYFARAAFSRGGVALLTNTGPLAGHVSVDDCHPTAEQPWLVQEFVDGPMVCSYSTFHEGRVTTHCTYRAPRQWEHSTGIAFLAVDGRPTLDIAQKIAARIAPEGYTGQLSFDFVERDGLLYAIECNPRTTDGGLLVTPEHLAGGLTGPNNEPTMVPEGEEVQLDFAVVADMFKEPLRQMPKTIHDLVHVADSSAGWHDHLPMLWSFLSMGRGERLSRKDHCAILEAMAEDCVWNGEAIDGMSEADAQALADVHAQRL